MTILFLSHSHTDRANAHRLADDLRDAGYEVWIDAVNIPASSLWADEIAQGVKESSHFLALWSPHAAKSEWVGKEIDMAEEHGKPIIPLLLSGEYNEMPDRLKRHQGYALHPNYRQGLADLLGQLPPAPGESVNLRQLLREGKATFGEVAARFERSQYPFGSREDVPVGIPLVRSACGAAYLFGRADDTLRAPDTVQMTVQFTGKQQDGDKFLREVEAFLAAQPNIDAEKRLWMVWVSGPHNASGDYYLPDDDPAVWADAAKLTWEAISQAASTQRPVHWFINAPTVLALAVGAGLRQKHSMFVYNLNRQARGDADRYNLVYQLTDAV